ncbi:MAG: hypothetical protein IT428_27320 [Planctomycetaceae bacterium]|nr:hypothetical protein [Planctomycetaceae bacterium]
MSPCRTLCVIASVGFLFAVSSAFSDEFKSAQEAYNAGAKAINEGNLAAARGPLEAALKQAPDDAFRLRVNRTLLIPYRELPDIEPMQRAAEYLITHSEQAAERSLTRRSLISFIHRRGKLPEAAKAYEERLKKNPDDRTVLFILVEAYAEPLKNPARSAELAERLAAVEKKLGKGQDVAGLAQQAQQYIKAGKAKEGAELYEQIAPLDAKLAAWHYKEAAQAWLKSGDQKKAFAAARLAEGADPEARNDQLAFFFHKALADVFSETGHPKEAIPHYEEAIKLTKIDGYLKDCQARLAKAKGALK